MKRSLIKLFSLQNIIALGTIIFAIIFWFYKIDGIPQRVENHESRLVELEQNKIELQTKMDMTLNSVMEIRALLHQFLLKEKEK